MSLNNNYTKVLHEDKIFLFFLAQQKQCNFEIFLNIYFDFKIFCVKWWNSSIYQENHLFKIPIDNQHCDDSESRTNLRNLFGELFFGKIYYLDTYTGKDFKNQILPKNAENSMIARARQNSVNDGKIQ